MLDASSARRLGRVPATPASTDGASATPRPVATRIDSRRLLEGGRELVIDHSGVEYRLRLTRNDKLILTK
jgi:hemin uptake protein HemP